MNAVTNADSMRTTESSLVTTLQVTYALHAVGLAIGALGASTIVGSFIFGWPSIIAVVINYVKRHDAKGTWLESHFQWQIRTFWFAFLASIIAIFSGAQLFALGIFGEYLARVFHRSTGQPSYTVRERTT